MKTAKQLTIIWMTALISGVICFAYINYSINERVRQDVAARSVYAR